jgi:uncharacterized membrane-anchored protein YitT (DUF2179 family)
MESMLDFLSWEWTDPLFDALLLGLTFGTFALAAALGYLWYRRRRWARNLYVVIQVAMFPVLIWALWKIPPESWDVWVGVVCYGILDVVVLALLATRSAREWYGRPPVS